jgi:uridylate kinase
MRRRCIVIKVSGVAFEHPDGDSYIRTLAEMTAKASHHHSVGITIGGGATARAYIQRALSLGLSPVRASHLGGDIGLMNARLFLGALYAASANAPPEPVMSFANAMTQLHLGQVAVLYGYWPGLTSDSVATSFAGYAHADLVIKLSRSAGVFDVDPVGDPQATLIEKMTAAELVSLAIAADSRAPGSSFVVDLLAAKSVSVNSIPLLVAHWTDIDSVRAVLEGEGTPPLPLPGCTLVVP